MKTLKNSAFEKVLQTLTFAEAVEYLKLRSGGGDVFDKLTSREGVHFVAALCKSADRIELLSAILGRFDLHTPEEWLEHVISLTQGVSWDYGYKFQRLLANGYEEDFAGGPNMLDAEDGFIRVDPIEPFNGFDLYKVNPGLPLVPYISLQGMRTFKVRIQGSLPLLGMIGSHLFLSLTFGVVSREDEADLRESFDKQIDESPEHFKIQRLSIPFFFDNNLPEGDLLVIENKIYGQIVNYMKEFSLQHDAKSTPKQMIIERWEADGDWDDRIDDLLPISWDDCIRMTSENMHGFQNKILFASPSFDLDESDHNQIDVFMQDDTTVVRADFHFDKIRMI